MSKWLNQFMNFSMGNVVWNTFGWSFKLLSDAIMLFYKVKEVVNVKAIFISADYEAMHTVI